MPMHDSGHRQQFNGGAVRDTAEGKPRPDLLSPFAMRRLGQWARLGGQKYTDRNWERGMPLTRCIASCYRHLLAVMAGDMDEDHLAAVAWNAMAVMHYEEMISRGVLPAELDDRPHYEQPQKNGSRVGDDTPCAEDGVAPAIPEVPEASQSSSGGPGP